MLGLMEPAYQIPCGPHSPPLGDPLPPGSLTAWPTLSDPPPLLPVRWKMNKFKSVPSKVTAYMGGPTLKKEGYPDPSWQPTASDEPAAAEL